MKKSPSSTALSPLALLCAGVFTVSTLMFVTLFFHNEFQTGYRSLKAKQAPLAPIFVQPALNLPSLPAPSPAAEPDESTQAKEAQKIFIAYELGDLRLASSLAADFLSSYPENPLRHRVRLVGAHIMNQNGDSLGALGYIKAILSEGGISNQDYTDSILLLGSIAREHKQYDSYIQSYLEQAYFRAAEPTRSKLAFYLGYLLLNKKDFSAASRYFNNVIGEDGVLGRAELYAAEEKRPETINALAEFLDQYPASSNYGYAKAVFLKEARLQAASLSARGYDDSALAVLGKITARFPGTKDGDSALLETAEIYERKLNPSAMKAALEKILDNEEPFYDPDALFRLGKLSFTQDRHPEALGYFRVLTEKFPTSSYIKETLEWQKLILDSLRE